MGVFGDLDTPGSRKPEVAIKQLSEFTLRVYEAVLDPPTKKVCVRAAAKVSYSDTSAAAGTSVYFFINGHKLAETITDDFGIAEINHSFEPHLFRDRDNEMVARLRGYSTEAKASLDLTHKAVVIDKVIHKWDRQIPIYRFHHIRRYDIRFKSVVSDYIDTNYTRYEGLILRIKARGSHSTFNLSGIRVQVVVVSQNTTTHTLGTATLDQHGSTTISLDHIIHDEPGLVTTISSRWRFPSNEYYAASDINQPVCYERCYFNSKDARNTLANGNFKKFVRQKGDTINLWGHNIAVYAPEWQSAEMLLDVSKQGTYII